MPKQIIIDRGHSYTASGANGYIEETQYTHIWGEAIYNRIVELGGTAVLTSDGASKSQDLEVPVKEANAYGRDSVFLSVHLNAGVESANGCEIYHYNGAYKGETKSLIDAVYSAFRSVVPELRDRGIKGADYYVLRKTVMPAALLELAFVSNERDASIITNKAVIAKGSDAIARALMSVAGQGVNPPSAVQSQLENGEYLIVTNGGMALDVDQQTGQLQTWQVHGGDNQRFSYIDKVFHTKYGTVIDVEGGASVNGARVMTYQYTGGDNQRFDVTSDGYVYCVHSGKVWDVSGGSTKNGVPLIQWDRHNGSNQRWRFIKLSN